MLTRDDIMSMNEGSAIKFHRGSKKKFSKVVSVLRKSGLPIATKHEDNVMSFTYHDPKTGITHCDGNTAHHLRQVLNGLIGLYFE